MWRLYFAFVLFPVVNLAQSLEEKLQGTWLSINITDSLGNPASGEFGGSRNFLKFQFEGRRLFIALAFIIQNKLWRETSCSCGYTLQFEYDLPDYGGS